MWINLALQGDEAGFPSAGACFAGAHAQAAPSPVFLKSGY